MLIKINFKRNKIINCIIILTVVVLVYLLIDQIVFFSNKTDCIEFVNTYMQYTEDINILQSEIDTSDIYTKKKLIEKKELEFNNFYEKSYIMNAHNLKQKINLCNLYRIGAEKRIGGAGELRKFQIQSIKVKSIYKIPFVSYVTVKLEYNISYEANGSISCFNGVSVFERQSDTIDEAYSELENIQVTFNLKSVNNEWKILGIPEQVIKG